MEGTALYRPILKKAWLMTKKFKYLWFFGFFATILGSSGEYEMLIRITPQTGKNNSVIGATWASFKAGLENSLASDSGLLTSLFSAIKASPQSIVLVVFIFMLALTIALFVLWLAIISEIGLIRGTVWAGKNKKLTITNGVDFAVTKFWPVLAANALMKLAVFILFIIVGWEISFLSTQGPIGTIIYYVSFVIFALITFAISFVSRYQLYYIVIGKQKVFPALKSGWQLFKKNWLISYEMAFILLVLSLLITVIGVFAGLAILSIPINLPVFFPLEPWLGMIIALISVLAVLALNFFIAAVLTTFQWSCWTLLFDNIDKGQSISKITRTAQDLPTYILNKK